MTLVISNYLTCHILIDNDSLADILFLLTFDQMGIMWDKLRLVQTPLVEFIGDRLLLLGTINFSITAGMGECQTTRVIDFLVVDCPLAYNGILRRLALNQLRAVTSMYYILMHFPTEERIRELRRDQAVARECYMASLKGKKSLKRICQLKALKYEMRGPE